MFNIFKRFSFWREVRRHKAKNKQYNQGYTFARKCYATIQDAQPYLEAYVESEKGFGTYNSFDMGVEAYIHQILTKQ